MLVQKCPDCGENNFSSVPRGSCWNCKGSLMSVPAQLPPALTETQKMQLAGEVEKQHEEFVRQFFPRSCFRGKV